MIGLIAATLASASLAAIQPTTGVYDENVVRTNTVDSSLTSYTVSQFTSDVASAYSAGTGAVVPFDWGSGALLDSNLTFSDGIIDAQFAGGAKTLRFTVPTTSTIAFGLGSGNPISGRATAINGALAADGDDTAVPDLDILIGQITGGAAGEGVLKLGLTYIGRTNGGAITGTAQTTITAYFSGGTSESYATAANNSTGERFLGFSAPAGQFITRVLVDSPATDRRVFIEDLGFITGQVPEPTTLAFLATGGLLLARRRHT